MTTSNFDRRRAFTVTLVAGVLNVLGMSIDLAFWRIELHEVPAWHVVSLGVGFCVIGMALAYRATGRQWIASAAFVFSNLVIELAVWRASTPLAMGSAGWAPFQTEKLAILTVALLAPPSTWAGGLSIGIFAGGALAHFAAFDPDVGARLIAEPWATIAFTVFGLLLYFYRHHALEIERQMLEANAARRTVEHVSRMLLAIRDFSNTPLQTLYLTTALLRARCADDSELLDRMDRSLARLRELNEIMSRYESKAGWQTGDESLDAAATLQRGFTSSRASSIPAPRATARNR